MKYYTLKVLALRKETADTVTVIFKQPGLKKITYLPGQYLTVIFKINGRRYIRPYSFSSAPLVDTDLEVTIKRVPGGIVSNHIIDRLGIGDLVEVMEPMGSFTLDYDLIRLDTHLVLWGAGSGITPLMSIIKYALFKNLVKHVTLVYGNRTSDSVIFKDKIQSLKEQCTNAFSLRNFHTQLTIGQENPDVVQGRIDPAKVLSVMQSEGGFKNTVHYICGPTGLKESVKAVLSDLGIESKAIFSEEFEIVRDPADFESIITRMVAIKKDGEHLLVEVVKGKSILEAGLDARIELTYSCQVGDCLICKGRLTKGKVKMIGIAERPKELKENEYLLCCSFPLTDDVEVEKLI